MKPHKKILILSLTPVASSPRPIRQAHALLEAGYEVYVAGYVGKDAPDPKWHFISLPFQKNRFRKLYGLIGILPFLIDLAHRYIFSSFDLFAKLKSYPVDLILCHDHYTTPLAHQLSKIFQCTYLIDVHEHALTQNQPFSSIWKKLIWRLRRRYVHNIQKKYFPKARALTTVSEGIATSLQKDYKLPSKPTVIRSIPFYEASPLRLLEKDGPIKLLYHGNLSPDRGLEECIQAMAFSEERFSLTLRGSGDWDPRYHALLLKLALQSPARHRIYFEPPVPFEKIVSEASLFDIGLFIPHNQTLQQQHALPNKFFEYIMAGLALAVSDLPDIAQIVKSYNLGLLLPEASPQKIAHALNHLTHDTINNYKRNALHAAKELCWEKEVEKFEKLLS